MPIEGSCHCGRVRYEAEVDPESVLICHCTDCQGLSGSAFRTVAPAREGTFRFTAGTPKRYVKIGDSGARRVQTFCPECGSPIYSGPEEGVPGMLGIRVGTIRQRHQLPPRKQYFLSSALPWATACVGD